MTNTSPTSTSQLDTIWTLTNKVMNREKVAAHVDRRWLDEAEEALENLLDEINVKRAAVPKQEPRTITLSML